ncbi:trigger factor [Taibaiella sp. KBW10]|uniref:trigger factor n=1 Tax=Taibaiella sp. KBW10 TaxID=2153357 RepID=UPI000F598F36|nr:trigger factor [Taibaiella sp. KBW10]RQO30423.1 trigger factor [Taibaiella sp. KBW10]
MATVTREPIAKLHDKLIVKINKEDYLPSFEKNLKQYGKQANIPGFRKGNVPTGMVKKMFGQSVFTDAVIQQANEQLQQYLTTEKPSIFAQPLPLENAGMKFDMNAPEDFEFSFEIGLKPEFEVKPINDKKGTLNKYVITVDDKMLDEEVENIRKRAGKVENPDTLAQDSDMVYAAYQATDKDGNAVEGAAVIDDVVTLDKMPKKMQEMLKGAAAGATFTFQPTAVAEGDELKELLKDALKQDPENKEAAEAHYTLTLTKVGRLAPRDLDEAFFEEVFPGQEVKDEAAFRARIKEEMGKEINRIGSDRLQNDIFETLVHGTDIELPADFLKAWLQKGQEQVKTDEEVAKEWPSFEHQLRWTLISDKLVNDYKIVVSLEDVKEEMKVRVLAYFGNTAADAPWLEEYVDKMVNDENTLNETYRRLLMDKLFMEIASNMEVKDKAISLEDFQKLPSAHEAHVH